MGGVIAAAYGFFHAISWRLRAAVFILFGTLLVLTPGAAFAGGDLIVLPGVAIWVLLTREIRPGALTESVVVSLGAICGQPDIAVALAAGFTFVLCHVGLHGRRAFPGALLVVAALVLSSTPVWPDDVLIEAVSAGLLGAGVLGVADIAFGRHTSLRRRLQQSRRRIERLLRYVPVHYLGQRLDEPAMDCLLERLWMVVVMIDLEGFTAALVHWPLPRVESLVQSFVTRITVTAGRHHGAVVKLLGDGALVVFSEQPGRTRAQAAAAAVGFAADLRHCRFGAESGQPADSSLGVRAGMAAGECSLGDWGAAEILDYSVIGFPVNLASRLQTAAQSGGVVVCPETARLLRGSDVHTVPLALWLPGVGAITAARVAVGDGVC